ncbi:hypothetical protein HO173_000472 [Letharia columbiana]|uniref:Uncharacterized protein n=1 Tax=Letharia columbiana TaxID=112416 RepID=A0A8H6G753_9LECA|nr:uncharacterized protein HO173_000472 [Letharia columbiana]KAF6241760.1 hypothetical protein HO173_000472 [Letharia columbiana]
MKYICRQNKPQGKIVLYNSSILVLIDWNNHDRAYLIVETIPQNVAFNYIAEGAPLPPYVVQINHQMQLSEHARVSMIVAAADLRLYLPEDTWRVWLPCLPAKDIILFGGVAPAGLAI